MASLANFRTLGRPSCPLVHNVNTHLSNSSFRVWFRPIQIRSLPSKSKLLVVEAKAKKRAPTRTVDAKTLNLKLRKMYCGTCSKPRLSVFCSDKQLYAALVDDQNNKCLFYASTLQKTIRADPSIATTIDAARVVGEHLVKAAVNLNINEISAYDCHGCARRGLCGERIKAFEVPISTHGFLPR